MFYPISHTACDLCVARAGRVVDVHHLDGRSLLQCPPRLGVLLPVCLHDVGAAMDVLRQLVELGRLPRGSSNEGHEGKQHPF